MSNNYEQSESSAKVVMQKSRKPIHVRIVSIGAFLLLGGSVLIMLDYFVSFLTTQIAIPFLGMSKGGLKTLILTLRVEAWTIFILSLILAYRGEKVWAHRIGKSVRMLLLAFLCLLVAVTYSIGFAMILTFGIFFWAPRLTIDWPEWRLKLYRGLILGVILVVMIAEIGLTAGNIGVTLVGKLLTRRLAYFLTGMLVPISGLPLLIIFPLFMIAPAVIIAIWGLRPKIETFWKEFLHYPMGMIGLAIISTIVIIAVLAPVLAPYNWGDGSLALRDLLQKPSPEHILGTNQRGEDIFSRLLYGSQISLIVGFVASIVAVVIGTSVGLISGYYGGILDSVLMRITDVFLCLPTLPLMLIMLLIFGQGYGNVIIVIAILGWTGTARMVRSEALSLRERPLTEASHALGASDGYILTRHILPNTLPLILANMILGVVNAILSEAGIAFLGFVDIHGQPSWGIMLHWAWKNAALLANRWWWFMPPGLLILLTTLGFVFISHTADKVVNPRLRGRRE